MRIICDGFDRSEQDPPDCRFARSCQEAARYADSKGSGFWLVQRLLLDWYFRAQKLPKEIVDKWVRELKEASIDPEFVSKVENAGYAIDYADNALGEGKMWQKLVKKLGLAAE